MALAKRVRETVKHRDTTMAYLLALAVSVNTILLEASSVSSNGGP